ncbi:kelch-like protein 3 isoform X2 [Ostrea edulis]|uniref:kelch-like protein 3 isoform X2 n=1 Tax=Ostrea edulis TaxID=37623 RepID=UPI0020946EB9|nr:kelch-like protein 3 isoform X2 [Ostrea edulis]XP_056013089.1 kelch-like protein 3 isoform X2 [Ostrea edulis]
MSNGGGVSLVHTKSCSLSEDALALLESLPGLFRRTDGKFLREMKESREKEIKIDGMSPDIMKQLVDFAYTADISITQENAQQLLSAANLVQIHTIIQACCNFLEGEMDPSNCLGIHCFAEAHVCDELSDKARQYVIQHFTQVARQEEILLLPKEKLIEFISQNDLNVGSEEVVFDAILRWVKHDPKHRIPQLADVLQYVRLPLVSPYYLFDKVDSEHLLMTAPGCRPFLDEAMKYHILKDRRMEMLSPRMIPRQCMAVETVVYITGGEIYNKNYLNCVEGYNLEGGTWVKLKDLPFSRCHHCAVVSEDMHMYIAGGYNKENVVVNNVMRYERYLDKWIKVASMNTPRAKLGMATLDGYIYAIGGYDGTSNLCSVEKYCPQTNRWTCVSQLSQPVARIVATSLNGYLYAAGGVADPSDHCMNTFQRYSPIDDFWEQLAHMPTPRALSGLVSVKGVLYAVGGILDNSYASRELMSYDMEGDTWTLLPQMKETRYDPGVTTMGSKIYVLSGHDGENSFFSSIEVYDTDTSRWSELPILTLPYGRCRFTCVAMDTKQA